jgi:cellulose synthase/poly-beta-1,6-N-acetylglucosamine synthase-like glycosyltransferase
MPSSYSDALVAASPRFAPPRTPLPALLIHGGVIVLWMALFARAFRFNGVFAYSAGIVYAAYDTALLLYVGWQTRVLARGRPPTVAPAPAPGVARPRMTAVIAAYNEAASLPQTIDSLAAQSEPPDEIVIADDGSTDATAEVLARRYGFTVPRAGDVATAPVVSGQPALRWLRLPHRGKSHALNDALDHVATEAVLTIDADTLLAASAVAAMRDAFAAEPRLVAATGVLLPTCAPAAGRGTRLLLRFQSYEYVRNFLSRFAWARADSLLLISGAFAGFRTEALRRVGGFDPACLVEDYELIHRLRRYSVQNGLGWTTSVLGTAVATTEAPATVGAFLRQRRRWFGGFLQTQLWYRDMVGNWRYGTLGLAMLPVKALDTLQPIYGLTAIGLLVISVVTGQAAVAVPAIAVVAAKIGFDLGFHVWSVHLYRGWVAAETGVTARGALLVALIEPFSFQVLRHLGAAIGWLVFLSGYRGWGRPARSGLPTQAPVLTLASNRILDRREG